MTSVLVTTTGAIPVITAEITELLEGAWTARIEIDSDEDITGPVTLTDGLTAWVGVQKRGAQEHGRTIAQLVGGTGGLSGTLTARNYDSPFIADILGDLLLDAGEGLSPDVAEGLLLAQIERWSRHTGPGGLSLKQITDEATADHWRIRRDGLVWLGVEDYPVVPPTFIFTEISRDPAQDSITIAPDENQVLVAVGDNFLERNVAGVVTLIEPGSLRQIISWEDPNSTQDRLLGPMKDLVDAFVGRKIDYAKMYPSVVALQNADGTLDLVPDDASIRGDGFKRIQISYGLPGVSATVPPGGRVNLYFQNGDPKQPRAALWEGSGVTQIVVGDTALAQFAARADKVLTELQDIVDTFNSHTHVYVPGTGTPTPTDTALPQASDADSVASSKLKTE